MPPDPEALAAAKTARDADFMCEAIGPNTAVLKAAGKFASDAFDRAKVIHARGTGPMSNAFSGRSRMWLRKCAGKPRHRRGTDRWPQRGQTTEAAEPE